MQQQPCLHSYYSPQCLQDEAAEAHPGPSSPIREDMAKPRLMDARDPHPHGAPHYEDFHSSTLRLPSVYEPDFLSQEQLPAELEPPLSYPTWGVIPQYSLTLGGELAAENTLLFEDQFLDLSNHFPLPLSPPLVPVVAPSTIIESPEPHAGPRQVIEVPETSPCQAPTDELHFKWVVAKNAYCGDQQRPTRTPPVERTSPAKFFKGSQRDKPRQAMACFFCRTRKIACGRPSPSEPDQTCHQCLKRRGVCEYPTKSRRGLYARVPPDSLRTAQAEQAKLGRGQSSAPVIKNRKSVK